MIFGGHTYAGCDGSAIEECSGTWVLANGTWDQRCDGDDGCSQSPTRRTHVAMTYDPYTGLTWLYGGRDDLDDFQDVWTWNGTTWSEASTTNTPELQNGASMASDPGRRLLVLYGIDDVTGEVTT